MPPTDPLPSDPSRSGKEEGAVPAGSVLTVRDVSFAYDARPRGGDIRWVLHRVTFAARPGEFLCLLGPSGCGKSTLLQLVLGFLRPAEGTILLDGRPVTGPGTDRALVSQQSTLYPWLTVADNVALPLKVRGVGKGERRQRVREVLRLVGLPEAGPLWPDELSGGMVQRVMVARALVQQPRLLLMDEPLAALDAYSREQMRHEILRLWHRTRMTVLFTTHDIGEAVSLATRVMVMGSRPANIVHEESLAFGGAVAAGQGELHQFQGKRDFVAACERLRKVIRAVGKERYKAR